MIAAKETFRHERAAQHPGTATSRLYRIAGSLGAEISGVDLSEDLPDDVLAEVRAALLDNCVIFFRNQSLTPKQQLRFARRWGEIHLHPFMQGMADYPEILEIIKTPEDKKNFGGSWHTDQMFSPAPAMGTIVCAGSAVGRRRYDVHQPVPRI